MATKRPSPSTVSIVPVERIEQAIYMIRGHKVILDRELAERLGEVEARCDRHEGKIQAVFDVIRQLMEPPSNEQTERIGFQP
jgi:hypothetical protein